MGKTITTYLINGNPKGAQSIFISNKICKAVVIPRANLSVINKREELQTPAFYMLLGETIATEPLTYLGETENFVERIKNHDYKKGFWQKVIVFISKDGAMTKSDVQYLEFLGIKTAKQVGQYNLDDNKQVPKEPNLPEHQKDAMIEFFEDVKMLTSFTGCTIFDVLETKNEHLFYCKARNIEAKGVYNEKGFTVLKGSSIANSTVKSYDKYSNPEKRQLIISQITESIEGKLILKQNKTFSSPSAASDFCTGRSSNGWRDWKDQSGKNLDEIYRKRLENN